MVSRNVFDALTVKFLTSMQSAPRCLQQNCCRRVRGLKQLFGAGVHRLRREARLWLGCHTKTGMVQMSPCR